MGFENVRDRDTRFARHVDINVAIRSRVENCGNSFVVIADEIGKFSDALGLNSLENERHRTELTRTRDELQQHAHRGGSAAPRAMLNKCGFAAKITIEQGTARSTYFTSTVIGSR